MKKGRLLSWRRLGICLLAWTAASLFYFSQDWARRLLRDDPTPWHHVLIGWSIGVYTCAAFTPLMLWLGRRWPIGDSGWWRHFPLHMVAGSAIAAAVIAIETPVCIRSGILAPQLQAAPIGRVFTILLIACFHGYLLLYWVVIGIQAGARYYRQSQERKQMALRLDLKASELAAQLTEARLKALETQLQPHFLFNTLSAIAVLVRQQKTRQAEEMLVKLSDLLRGVLTDGDRHEVSLSQELEYLKLYLAIEQVRFQDRLSVVIYAEPSALEAAVPHLALQPIVENAIRHGLGRSLKPVRIELSARVDNGSLRLAVKDDGPGIAPGKAGSNGIGLANTRARLAHLYGDAAELKIENCAPSGAVVTMTLPYRAAVEREACA